MESECIGCGTELIIIRDYGVDEQIRVCAHCNGPDDKREGR